MARYINAEPILKKIAAEINKSEKYTAYESALDDAYFYVNNAPVADVQEVKHGKWIDKGHFTLMCSCCEEYVARNVLYGYKLDYCPKCGAKMDGDQLK